MSLEITQVDNGNNLKPLLVGIYNPSNQTWILDIPSDYEYIKESFIFEKDTYKGFYEIKTYSKIEYKSNVLFKYICFICHKFTDNLYNVKIKHPILFGNIEAFQGNLYVIENALGLIYNSKLMENIQTADIL